ncbi:MAG TPA: sugar phosphate isomerase/epimerase [Vicinamibacterales bacterium]|nr:sugar phosphate isomerase/epimerase [Vicinamibacterales bacterium]
MPHSPAPRLGLDTYSLRSQNWDAFQQLDYCAARGVKVVHFSEPRLVGGFDPAHLERVRAHADSRDLDIEIGMLSICPTSGIFDPAQGSAEGQLGRAIDAAVICGSPLVRCVLGNTFDRRMPGGIERHIDQVLQVLRRVRSRVIDAGVKIAIENHSGDMQARELRMLVETAGTDFVGVCIDSGNASWAIEDPHLTLETLAPYVLTSHMRDSALWNTPAGVVAQWTRMGEGNVDIAGYIRTYIERCPGRAVSLELIMHRQRTFDYHDDEFWTAYPSTPAREFARFLTRAEKGEPRPDVDASKTESVDDVDICLAWLKQTLESLITNH